MTNLLYNVQQPVKYYQKCVTRLPTVTMFIMTYH